MKVYSANEIRNIAVMGHSGCGKTSLMEAALNITKVTSRMGRTEDGNTVSDYDAEEIRRKVSVSASMIPIEWKNSKINFMDTPGYFDFVGAAREALYAADVVLILANAKSGVEVGTELAWESSQDKARVIFINGMDDEHADFFRVVEQMQSMFGGGIAPFMLPFKEGGKLTGYVETLTGKAFKFEGGACDVPGDMKDIYEDQHHALIEAIAETDEELMEKFFEAGTLTADEMTRGLKILAKDLGIPIVLLSQLNREVEDADLKIPQLSHLRESGAIEQDADTVLLLTRPAYYGITLEALQKKYKRMPHGIISTEGLMLINIAKQRSGSTGIIFCKHNEAINSFFDI